MSALAEMLLSTCTEIDKPVSMRSVSAVLEAITANGLEVAKHGSTDVAHHLTEECPGCGGSMVTESGSCDCIWGRVAKFDPLALKLGTALAASAEDLVGEGRDDDTLALLRLFGERLEERDRDWPPELEPAIEALQ